ncbi:MAG: IS1595 family transposase, partial [Patescibacteria group bacterium]
LGRSDGKHLQAYLDEFAYRFNRRRAADIFGRCLAAVAACPAWTYRDITGAGGGKA